VEPTGGEGRFTQYIIPSIGSDRVFHCPEMESMLQLTHIPLMVKCWFIDLYLVHRAHVLLSMVKEMINILVMMSL